MNVWRKRRRVQSAVALVLVLLGPVLLASTWFAVRSANTQDLGLTLRVVILLDLIYVLVIASLVIRRIFQLIAARRAQSAGSQLHLRLSAVFSMVALLPTVMVAVFATVTLNFGLESWFSERVRDVVGASLSAAQTYESEQRDDLIEDVVLLSNLLNRGRVVQGVEFENDLRLHLTDGQSVIQRGLKEAYIINGSGDLIARGERSYLFGYEQPSADVISGAFNGDPQVIEDWENNEFRSLRKLRAYVDRYLYISREVDGDILSLLDETKQTAQFYNFMESERGRLQLYLAMIYLGFALMVILASVWMAFWFADRLSRPVAQLAGAAQRVGAGDFDVQVQETGGDDEIAMLGRIFNRMTRQVKGQRDDLVEINDRTERRRRMFDTVLSGVTAGVVGLNAKGEIDVMNAAAARLLNLDPKADVGKELSWAVPEFVALFERLNAKNLRVQRDEINLTRAGSSEILLVRMAQRLNNGVLEGYVVTFDDVTDLVSAQRMAAWGDVAQRIAHEIKNPLTPIQLSAERLRRKFAPMVGEHSDALEQYADVIIRQTGDLRRIVDEFSKFARMPEPEKRSHDLVKLVKDSVVLQQTAMEGLIIEANLPNAPLVFEFDATMIGQALTNLIKNAGEAIEGVEPAKSYQGKIIVELEQDTGSVTITIADNGKGLPEDRSRLFEPYVTHRKEGTGLGLPIVKKIIEEHGGTLTLVDAPIFDGEKHAGAMARIVLPYSENSIDNAKES